jgi:hypothetical protein
MNLRIAKIVSLVVTLIGAAFMWQNSTFRALGDQRGYAPEQPVNFSHKVHAGDNKINCLYCHTAADKSKVAGVPSPSLCMNCHAQIRKDSPEVQKVARAAAENRPVEWVKVNDLPDHVVFNHSRHVTAGLSCQKCHGAVETMDVVEQADSFTMGTCVSCHRTHREVTLDAEGRPQIAREKSKGLLKASTDCAVCHH